MTDFVPSSSSYLFQENLFQQMVDDAAVGIAVFEKDELIYANARLIQMFGYTSVPDFPSHTNFLCSHASPSTLSMMQERDELMRQGDPYPGSFVADFTLDDGKKMFLEVHSRGFHSQNGFLRVCFMIDVTEKIGMRAKLDKQIQSFQSIIGGTGAATWELNLIDKSGIYDNKWVDILGYEIPELQILAKNWLNILHPNDGEKIMKLRDDLINRKTELLIFEARFRHKKGHWVWISSRGRISKWTEDGAPLILSGANIDITEKKLAEQQLVEAKEELERSLNELSIASRAKEDFLSIMSHEIRTPLNAVIGLTNLLLRRNPRPDQLEIVRTVKNAGDNLLHLVNDILDYSKINSGKLQLEFIRFNFNEFLAHLYSIFRLDAQDRNIDLELKADSQIPKILQGDVARLNQIFINLLGNALKFTRKGKVSLDASLVSEKDGNCVIRFVITDTGVGIHPSRIERIFEPFHQSDASINREFGGTGLGLSIVKGLVKMFHGTLDVESIPGEGTTFTVVLTLHEENNKIVETTKITRELSARNERMNILYVEDVASNRFLVAHLMEEFDLKCDIAEDGKEALAKTLVKKYDAILMDIQMPGMNGYEISDLVYTQPDGKNNDTPIIAFTAEPVTDLLREKLYAHHMRDVISKPFNIDQFVEKILSL